MKNQTSDEALENKLDELINNNIDSIYSFNSKINLNELETILRNLPNGKSVGPSGVSNEMIKYCESAHLTCLFKELFEKMINFSIMPYLFNLSIFKPLVKDPKKSTIDISNLRPIAVSDVYANIFEKILLDEINKCHTDNNKQFGFKKSSSCSHAIFIQLMLYKF